MIPFVIDTATLDTNCIGIKPVKSSSKSKINRKRTINESLSNDVRALAPKRKKRKANKSHRDAFPGFSDTEIRCRLDQKRKAKNRKSARDSRERRKQQETYLKEQLPKAVAFKTLLKESLNIIAPNSNSNNSQNDSLECALKKDNELSQMKMILDKMAENNGTESDEYGANKHVITDELICEILSEYLDSLDCENKTESDSASDLLETDHDPIYLQIINEIQNDGDVMTKDDDTKSVSLFSTKSSHERSNSNKAKKDTLQTDIFDEGSIDHIDSESAVFTDPVHQETMLKQCRMHQNITTVLVENKVRQTPSYLNPVNMKKDSMTKENLNGITTTIIKQKVAPQIAPFVRKMNHFTPQLHHIMNGSRNNCRNGRNLKNGKNLNDTKSGRKTHYTQIVQDIMMTILVMLMHLMIATINTRNPSQYRHKTQEMKEVLRCLIAQFMKKQCREIKDWNQNGKDRKMKVWIEKYLTEIMEKIEYHLMLVKKEKVNRMFYAYQICLKITVAIIQDLESAKTEIMNGTNSRWVWMDFQDFAAHKQCLEESQMNQMNGSQSIINCDVYC